MRTCTCPMQATRNGFVITGHDALCPFHGVAPPTPQPNGPHPRTAGDMEPRPAFEGVRYCEECGRQHAAVRCDFVDET
jgi:hypothetical protein